MVWAPSGDGSVTVGAGRGCPRSACGGAEAATSCSKRLLQAPLFQRLRARFRWIVLLVALLTPLVVQAQLQLVGGWRSWLRQSAPARNQPWES